MFEGKIVRLRGIELSDLDKIMEDFNKLELRRFLATPLPFSREEEKEWIKSTWERKRKGQAYLFAIEEKKTKEYLGSCGLESIDNINRTCELGIAIYKRENWGRGYGTDALKVLLSIAFDYLNFHRVELRVYDYNIRGIKAYEKVGFRKVGTRRKCRYFEGEYFDEVIMDILREEWLLLNKEKK
jgi:RimJ/RimL family protein N-acetyltransferase